MRSRLFIASLWTLSLLFGMLAAIILLISYKFGHISAPVVFTITLIIDIIIWLLSPRLTDWIQKIFYKAVYYNEQQFNETYPQYAQFINQQCAANKTPFPKIGFIDDDNPTAFSYGSGRWNSRLVFTRGILTYLEPGEVEAVLAHELGHIVHRDFIVMSIANAIIQFLYEIYYILARSTRGGGNKNAGAFALIGYLAFIFYLIGTYIVLFLNRMREYYADEFSAQTTHRPDALENALVKIAYGIMNKEDTGREARLMESTKTMGIMSLASAKSAALAVKVSNMEPDKVARVMLFDIVSPWAKLAQLAATHPLTGRRLLRLEKMAETEGQPQRYNLEAAKAESQLSKARLWRGFFFGAFIYFIPWLLIVGWVAALILLNGHHPSSGLVGGLSFAVILAALLLRLFYKYPRTRNNPTTIYDLMTDIYASPLRGRPVALDGAIIGRGVPGYVFGEDMMLQDNTGLLYLDYRGRIPLFSNLMFALKKVKKLVGQNVAATGWFYRSNIQYLRLKNINASEGRFKSYPRLWGFVGSFLIAALASGLLLGASQTNAVTNASLQSTPSVLVNSNCYSLVGPSSLAPDANGCSLKMATTSSSYQILHPDQLSTLSIKAQILYGTYTNYSATFRYDDPSFTVISRSNAVIAGLPATKILATTPAAPKYTYISYIIDTSTFIKGGNSEYVTVIYSAYRTPAQIQQLNKILSTLEIKNTTLCNGDCSYVNL